MPKGVPNKRYTPEFKEMVECRIREDNMAYNEAEREYGIAHGMIQKWERIYLTEGIEGLAVERRGRSSKGRSLKLPKEVEEDLLAENQRLRAEIAYLKNCKPWFWKKSDTRAKSKGDPGTKARTRSDNIAGNRSTAKSYFLLPPQESR